MQNNLKKIGVIGACLVAMIGSGACVSRYITQQNDYKQEHQKEFAYFSMMKTKAELPNAEPFDMWHYGNIILDKHARDLLHLNLTDKQIDTLHQTYLIKAYNTGYLSAKLQYADELMHTALGLHRSDHNLGYFETAKIADNDKLLQGLHLTGEVLLKTCKTRTYSEYTQLPNETDYPFNQNFLMYNLWWLTVFLRENQNLTIEDEAWQITASLLLFGDTYCGEDTYPFNPQKITLADFSKLPLKEQVYNYTYARFINQTSHIDSILNQLAPSQKQQITSVSNQVLKRFYQMFDNYVTQHPQRPKNHSEIENEAYRNIILNKEALTVLQPSKLEK